MNNYPPIELSNGYRVETWYDRHTRAYVTQLKDVNGNQIGDASYDVLATSVNAARASMRALGTQQKADEPVIHTEHRPKPVGSRTFDWQAWYDGTDGDEGPIGFGSTQAEAVASLKEQSEVTTSVGEEEDPERWDGGMI